MIVVLDLQVGIDERYGNFAITVVIKHERWEAVSEHQKLRNPVSAFSAGALVGILAGLIGLGGAEFRLPLLVSLFSFPALQAVIINKAMSLIVVSQRPRSARAPPRLQPLPPIGQSS